MWEAIAANRRRSFWLIVVMALILGALGAALGAALDPQAGPPLGIGVALVLWAGLWIAALTSGDQILLGTVGAREIQKADAPRLWNVVEEMCLASGLRTMPRIYLIENDAPNAFAAGRKPERASVAVTSGLLRRLNRDELQGVIAHEIGHIRNLDIRFMMLAAVMVGSVTLLADTFFRSMRYGRVRGGRRSGGQSNAQAQLIFFALAIAMAILAPLFAQALYYACSRQREYLADASAARYTRYPLGLASALEKIAAGGDGLKKVNRVLPPMFIVNPNQPLAASSLFSTHPPTGKRIEILRRMAGNAGYGAYEAAFHQVTGKKARLLGLRTIEEGRDVPLRAALAGEDDGRRDIIEGSREALDVLARGAGYLLVPCECGVRMKLPPQYTADTITCARCGREHVLPRAAASKRSGGTRFP